MTEISHRLQTIGDMVKRGNRVADIGSDHAYLPTYLIQRQISPQCIAGEVNRGPWESASRQVRSSNLEDKIEVRLGDGLAVLRQNEADTICISGMGGSLIVSILSEGEEKLEGVTQLLLQPNVAAPLVRKWLIEHGWELIEEKIIEEDGVIYEILHAVPGDSKKPYENQDRSLEELLQLGPVLWRDKPPVLHKKWVQEKDKLLSIQGQIAKSNTAEAERKREEIAGKISWIEEVLSCLPADRE
ncbi:tRNA (adenine(22)-N(1))-methyltransferase [Aneurinibacillus tyrosinisolvens]|uniref:tRNA (adenine(22)-N(1))-methyltransferase n=1 Tax=Aneurinibacillus tyrosinisolvens TaxID=1443435 RepID=UPI00063EFAE9|nr:class I SAM-dependent methyltransferase [Aneurinibacillus tyrosinisolvens]